MVGSNIYFYRLDKIVGRRKYGEAVVDRGVSVRYNNHHHNNNNNNNHHDDYNTDRYYHYYPPHN